MKVNKIDISATIVLYKEDSLVLKKTIESFLKTPLNKKLFLIDNSPTDRLKSISNHTDVEYHFIGKNCGFGTGHNKVLSKIKTLSKYHLILNPDVSFESTIIPNLIKELQKDDTLAMISPKVIYPNKEFQYTCRKHPTIKEIISRRLKIFKNYIQEREYRNTDLSKAFFPEFIHGAFMLFKTSDFIKISGFDERYFLYMEDADICRKIDRVGKRKMYHPKDSIIHLHKKGSSKKVKLLYYHISSAIKYFNKWGI